MKKPTQFGKYFLFDRVAVGGMAEVFRAKTLGADGSERIVAVKRILPDVAADKELVSMFIDEAKIAVQLNHPNICQVFDWGKVDDSYFIAMEYVSGRDLRSVFQRCKQQPEGGVPTMPLAQACLVVMKLCEGLDYAHNKKDSLGNDLNLVHRDVSPQNVMLSYDGEVKLIDFGIAKVNASREAQTEAGVLKGKFAYMSPEQVRGEPLDRRSDIFTAGIVLYELLTGERLFPTDSELSSLEKIRNVEILPPTAYNKRIPEELERIVMRALAAKLEERYQTALELHDDLQSFMYTAGEFYSRKELKAWMLQRFRAEFDAESAVLEAAREVKLAAVAPSGEPLARARTTMSMAAMRDPTGAFRVGPPGKDPTGAFRVGAPGKDPTGMFRAGAPGKDPTDSQSGQPSSWTPSRQKPKRPGSAPPPPPRGAVQSIAEAAASMAQPGGARPITGPRSQPAAFSDEYHDTTVDGPRGTGRRPAVGSRSRPPSSPVVADLGEGETRAFPPRRTDDDNETAAYEPARAGDLTVPAPAAAREEAGTVPMSRDLLVTPPLGVAPVQAQPQAQPRPQRVSGPPVARPQPLIEDEEAEPPRPAPVSARPHVLPPPPVADPEFSAPALPAVKPGGGSSAVGVVLLLLLLVVAGAGGAYWFLLRPGELIVVADPPRELTLLVDQIPVGMMDSPLRVPVKPGAHTVVVQHAGYTPWTEVVRVQAGEAIVRNIRLENVLPQTGGFTLLSEPPGAAAFLDGLPLGQVTPMRVQSVLIGPHQLELRLEKENRVYKQQVVIESGKMLEIKAVIPPAAGAAPVATPEPPTTPTPTPATRPETPPAPETPTEVKPATPAGKPGTPVRVDPRRGNKRPPAAGAGGRAPAPGKPLSGSDGYLRLNSKPWTKIIVDGVDTGLNTPQTSYRMRAGRHTITLVNPQFGISETFSVSITPGETQTVIKDLQRR